MPDSAPGRDLLTVYASSRPTRRYYGAFSVFCLGFTLDFFDFYLVGFLVAVLGPGWHLTYGQSSMILLSAGAGAILGSLCTGALADAFGRKRLLLASTTLCGCAAGAVAFLPEGDWHGFAVLRFLVGFGLAGAATTQTVLLVELTPGAYRKRLTGFPFVAASVGSLVASLLAAAFLHAFGWRGVAALGLSPLLVTLSAAFAVPESAQWLLGKARPNEARAVFAWLLRVEPGQLPPAPPAATHGPDTTGEGAGHGAAPPVPDADGLMSLPWRTLLVVLSWGALSTAGYGVYLWGPAIVSLLLRVPAAQSAGYFVIVALAGIAGRLLFSVLPAWWSRRRLCCLTGFGIALALAAAGIESQALVAGFPVFVICVALAAVFFDGGWCVIGPYSAEIFPTRLAARAIGIGQAANGVGKILGPLCLAMIAGTGNLVTPRATADAVLPAFLFLGGCGLLMGLLFLLGAPADSAQTGTARSRSAAREAAAVRPLH